MSKVTHYRITTPRNKDKLYQNLETHLACKPSEILPSNTGEPKGSSKNTREVTCPACLRSQEFQTEHKKALRKSVHYLHVIWHTRKDGTLLGSFGYRIGCLIKTVYGGGSSENPGTTGKVEEVTCLNCLRTRAYQEGIEQLKDEACGIRARRMELKRELAETEERLRAVKAL